MHVWKFILWSGQNREKPLDWKKYTHSCKWGFHTKKKLRKKCILKETPVLFPHLAPRIVAQGLLSFRQELKEYSLGNLTCSKDTSGVIQQTARPPRPNNEADELRPHVW